MLDSNVRVIIAEDQLPRHFRLDKVVTNLLSAFTGSPETLASLKSDLHKVLTLADEKLY